MLYITSYCSSERSIARGIERLASLGFKNIELTGGTASSEYSEEKLHYLRDKFGLSYLIHNYFPPQKENFVLNLASGDISTRSKTFNMINQAVALSKEFSQHLYSIHAGYVHDLSPAKGKDGLFLPANPGKNTKKAFYDALEHIVSNLLPKGFNLAVENAFPAYGNDRFSMLSSPEDIFEFLKFAECCPNVGLLLDLGHLNVAAYYQRFDREMFLEKLLSDFGHKIFELHLSRNNGVEDTHKICRVESFEVQFVGANWEIFKEIPIVLEWHQCLSPLVYDEFKRIESFLNKRSF
jgi:sugar phosphate isomerase/epimerase